MAPAIALSLNRVTKRFRDHDAVLDLSLEVRAGTVFGLLGPNGAGKTTAMRMIVGILAPDSGQVRVLGEPVSAALKRRIGYLPEERGLYSRMKVGDLLVYFGVLKGVEPGEARRRSGEWLERFGLSEWRDREIRTLSKGMSQKVQFALAVLHEPEFLILDEPFSGLDPVTVRAFEQTVLDLSRRGTTILLSTHQMERAEKLCDEIVLIHRARKVLEGTLADVRRRFGGNIVRIEFRGTDLFLSHPSVLSVARDDQGDDHSAEVRLRDGAEPDELLARALSSGARIVRFERIEPSLDDIFVAMVGNAA